MCTTSFLYLTNTTLLEIKLIKKHIINPANNMNMTHRPTFKFSDDFNVPQYVYTIIN